MTKSLWQTEKVVTLSKYAYILFPKAISKNNHHYHASCLLFFKALWQLLREED